MATISRLGPWGEGLPESNPLMSGNGSEQFRESTRAPLAAPVKLKFDSFEEMQNGFTANVSRGGMFVRGAEPRPVGTLLKFELQVGGSSAPVAGMGEVVWIRLKQKDLEHPSGMGIQFRHLEADSLATLDRAVREALAAGQGPAGSTATSLAASRRSGRLLEELEAALARRHDRANRGFDD